MVLKSPLDTNDLSKTDPTHADQSNDNGDVLSRGLLNILLVFLESTLTLMLRFDPTLRQLAYPLAQSSKIVCIRTYLPHTKIYASFSYQGILLDDALPNNKQAADIVINAYSFQLLKLFTDHHASSVDALQIRGETQDVEQLKAFLLRMGVGGTIQNIIHKLKGSPKPKPSAKEREDKLASYKNRIDEQTKQIDHLTMQNSRLNTQLAEAHTKQKTMSIALIALCILFLLAVGSHFIW